MGSGSPGSPPLTGNAGSILPEVVAQAVAILRADPAMAARLPGETPGEVKVWNNPPPHTAPPYVWVWSGAEFDGRKLGPGFFGRRGTLNVVPVSRYRGTKELDELGDLVMRALNHQALVIPNYREAGIEWDETFPPTQAEAEGGPQWMRVLVFRASAR